MAFKILLVDDSKLVRVAVGDILKEILGVEVCGEAVNGQECITFLETHTVDLIILDVEMPVLDGLSTLKEIRRKKIDVKIIMLSTLTLHGALTTFRALDLGALDFVPKPSPDSGLTFSDIKEVLKSRVTFLQGAALKTKTEIPLPVVNDLEMLSKIKLRKHLILTIGVSTGGPPAITEVLKGLPATFPVPIIIVQHMPAVFTNAFAKRLNEMSALHVSEAKHEEKLEAGHVYIVPGDYHLHVSGSRAAPVALLNQDPARNSHRPSIDTTLESTIDVFCENSVALIMTGMGNDGLLGMTKLKEAGALTLAQDEDSSVIYGMNKRAIEAGTIDRIVSLSSISKNLCEIFEV